MGNAFSSFWLGRQLDRDKGQERFVTSRISFRIEWATIKRTTVRPPTPWQQFWIVFSISFQQYRTFCTNWSNKQVVPGCKPVISIFHQWTLRIWASSLGEFSQWHEPWCVSDRTSRRRVQCTEESSSPSVSVCHEFRHQWNLFRCECQQLVKYWERYEHRVFTAAERFGSTTVCRWYFNSTGLEETARGASSKRRRTAKDLGDAS